MALIHDDVIKWKPFPRYWPFVRGIHRSPVNSLHKGQWRGASIFSLICAWLCKQPRRRCFETPPRSLWRHGNAHWRQVNHYVFISLLPRAVHLLVGVDKSFNCPGYGAWVHDARGETQAAATAYSMGERGESHANPCGDDFILRNIQIQQNPAIKATQDGGLSKE